ncbi:MAG: hypothetical protein ISS15_13350 [Alphaproteobacteria bacterium]|nr:hypothetical protein [Alphaproteobacteria bacterium]MBL7098639.1 hypothetical protein [Alphaproteobacteria bacterium]
MMPMSHVLADMLATTPWWGVGLLVAGLALHIAGGSAGVLAGYAAVTVRKGGDMHRAFGMAFVLAMLAMGGAAIVLAVPLREPSNVAGGVLATYLVTTGWLTMQRPAGRIGAAEKVGLAVIALVAAGDGSLAVQAYASPTHALEGFSYVYYAVFAAIAAAIALTDLRVVLRGRLSPNERLRRHLWRMCFVFFFAAGSFFIGQQKVMPHWLHGSPVLYVLGLAPLGVMAYWLVRTRQSRARAKLPAAAAPA